MSNKYTTKDIIFTTGFGIITVFLLVALIFWTIIPYIQMKKYVKALSSGNIGRVLEDEFVFKPYSYVQEQIRFDLLKGTTEEYRKDPEVVARLFEKSVLEMEKLIEKERLYPRDFSRLATAYEAKAQNLEDVSWYEKAGEMYKKALEIAPLREEIYYAYALNLAYQGKMSDSIKMMRETLSRNEKIPHSYFYLGTVLSMGDEEKYIEALDNLEIAFISPSFTALDEKAVQQIYEKFFVFFYELKDQENLLKTISRLVELDEEQNENYKALIEYIQTKGQIPPIEFE